MNKKEKPLEVASSLKSADRLLFGIFLKANAEGRELTASEKSIVDAINKDKVSILVSLAQSSPAFGDSENPLQDPVVPPVNSEADFMDGNPTVSGDEAYWSTQSGFNPSAGEENIGDITDPSVSIEADPNADSGFDFPEPMSGISGVSSRDVSYTGGIGQTSTSPTEPAVDGAIKPEDPKEIVDEAPF